MKGGALGPWQGQAAFLGVLAAVLAGALALGAAGWRAYAEIAAQTGKYRNYKALQVNAGKADSLSAAYASIQEDLRGLRAALPEKNQGSQVLNTLVEDAQACSLSIAGITSLDEVPFPGYRELPFDVNLAGGFKDMVRYVHALETRGMVLQVRRLEAQAESINKARVKAKLELSVFVPGNAGATRTPAAGQDGAAEPGGRVAP
jgi:Tfp pilus assembly protein PilO